MAKPAIATVRTAIKTRLATAYTGTSWHAYAKQYGNELMPAFIVFPVPRAAGWHLATAGDGSDGSCPIAYTFVIEVWAPISGGVDKAQDMIDRIISPYGTDALSIEGHLENRAGTYNGDALDLLETSTRCDQFMSYGFGALNSDTNDAIVARIPVEVFV